MLGLASPVLPGPVASDDCSSAPASRRGTYAFFDLTQASGGTPGLERLRPAAGSERYSRRRLAGLRAERTGFAVVHTACSPTDAQHRVGLWSDAPAGELACSFNGSKTALP